MTRRGLGRGLDALLSSTDSGAPGLREIAVDRIQPNPFQPRREIDGDDLDALVVSIKAHGLLQPLVARMEGEEYQLIAGERRWRAAMAAGLETVPVVIKDAGPQEMLALAMVENVQRSDLAPLETAEAYNRLMDEFGLTQQEVANIVGKSRAAVANTARLVSLSEPVRQLLQDGKLTEGHARALIAVDDPEAQLSLARRAAVGGWTVRKVESAVRDHLSSPGRPRKRRAGRGTLDPDTAAAVRALEEALGTKVQISRRGPAGRLVIHFYSEEELSALYDLLTGGP